MALQDTNKFLKDMNKSVGKDVRRNMNKFYTQVCMTNTSVGQGLKEGYESLRETMGTDYIEIPDSQWPIFGTACLHAIHAYCFKPNTHCTLVAGAGTNVPGQIITYAARRDVKTPYDTAKKTGTDAISAWLSSNGGRALRGLADEKTNDPDFKGGGGQSEVGRVKNFIHRAHRNVTTVGAAQLTSSLAFLSKTKFFGGYATTEEFKDIMKVYEDLQYTYITSGTKKGGIRLELREGQQIEIDLGPRSKNIAGMEPTDWKNLRPSLEKAIRAYIEKTPIAERPGSKSIVDVAVEAAEYNIIQTLITGKNVTTTSNSKPKQRKRKKVTKVITNKRKPPKKPVKKAPTSRGKKTQVSTATNILSLAALINAKLPETVRKNMKSPGLVNRTGRFANSTRIVDAIYTKNGYPSFGYTYQKDPYQVFEPASGAAPWSNQQRDPKKLIDRSIREIAATILQGRFFTRRI